MPDSLTPLSSGAGGDPFADIDPQMEGQQEVADHDDPFADVPKLSQHTTGTFGSFLSGAARGVLPTAAGMAAAGTGAEVGGAAGAAIGGPIGGLVGGLVGGLGGFFAGSSATESAQQWGLNQLPDSWTDALGQSERAQRAQEAQHPIASFLGGIAPYALTMSPGAFTTKAIGLPENATTFQRLMANPITGRLFGGAAMGGMELGQEEAEGQSPDWTKIGISTGFGLIFNKPTHFGESLTEAGAQLPYTLMSPARGLAAGAAMRFGPMTVPPEGYLTHLEPTVAQAGDLGVIGPGATEETFRGDQQQSPETQITAHNTAADEQAAIGAWPTPDQEAVARRSAPELFARNDELLAQRDALRQFVQEASNPPDTAFDELTSKRSEVEEALRVSNPNSPDARGYRATLGELAAQEQELTERRQAWEAGTAVDTPEVMLARQHLQDTEHALWDLGPEVSAARRRAAEAVGDLETPPAIPVTGPTIEGEVAPPPEPVTKLGEAAEAAPLEAQPAEKTVEQQRAFIIADRAAQLMNVGIPRPEAVANATLLADQYVVRSHLFNGALGSPEDLYRSWRTAEVRGADGQPAQPATSAAPLPVKIRTIADIQAQEKVSPRRAKAIQDQEILAKGRPVEPIRFGEPPPRAPQPEAPTPEPAAAPPAEPARAPELAEVPQEALAPAARPRLRSTDEIMREDRVGPTQVQAIQDRELTALAEWQAQNRSPEPRPKRNRATAKLAEAAGVPGAGIPEPEVLDEIVDRLPPERVAEEITAEAEAGEIEYQEAEKAAEEIAPEVRESPDQFYDADQTRPDEELEREHQSPIEAAALEQRPVGGGEPEATTVGAGPVPEGGGPSGAVGGAGGRAAEEAGEPVELAVAAAGAGPDYRPEPAGGATAAAEPIAATGQPELAGGTAATSGVGNRAGMSVIETQHTKTGKPLWVVTGGPRVERAEYNQMLSEAKQNGGRWSSFRGRGAIPGWTFDSREGAEAFMRGGEAPAQQAAPTTALGIGWEGGFARSIAEAFRTGGTEAAKAEFEDIVSRNHLTLAEGQMLSARARDAMREAGWQGGEAHAPQAIPATAEAITGAFNVPGTDEHWWNRTLTPYGRQQIMTETGVRLPTSVTWHNISPESQARLASKRAKLPVATQTPTEVTEQAGLARPAPPEPRGPTPIPATPEARNVSDALAPADGKGPLPVTSAPPEPRARRAPSDWSDIGKNHIGQTLYEDQRGVRSIVENGVRSTEPVGIRPGTREVSTDRTNRPEYQVAEWHPTIEGREPEYRAAPEPAPPTVPAEPGTYGANNKMFTADAAEAARARLRERLNRLNTGFDPQTMLDGLTLAGFHIEAGARSFADYSRAMIADLGENIRPYLQHFYNSVRDFPGFDARGMDGRNEVERATIEAPAPPRGPETPEEQADIDRLLDTRQHDPIINDIARLTAEGRTPEEIEEERPGDHYSLEEIDGIVRALERRGEIPELEEPEEDGIQGTLPLRDEGTGAEDVHGAPAESDAGGAPTGEVGGGAPTAEGVAGEQASEQVGQPPPGGREGGGGDRPPSTDRIPDTGEGSKSGATGRFADRPDARVEGENFSIEPGDLAEGRGRRQKARDNLAAIDLAKRLIQEDRPATKAEQAILVKYTGWGGLKGAFEGSDRKFGTGFEDIGNSLKGLLSPEEYRRAAQSTQYAHYTAEHVVRSMWDAVRRMGFKGGLAFEPGMGIGHFLGMMPQDLAHATEYSGIERDNLTAQIAKLLYPESGVRQADYTRTPMPQDYFDLVIGNPPFGDIKISADPKYAARGFSLHDYFFAKSLDSVRPGGLLAFITSAHTMNNMGAEARNYMADRAEFVGGVRLPSSTFRQNAGTEVTTDILFLRKRAEGEEAGPRDWTETVQRTLPSEKFGPTEANVSRYFSEHPENVLGKEVWGEMQATGDYAVEQTPGTDLPTDLRAAIERLPADVMTDPPTPEERASLDFESGQKKDGSFYLADDGTLMQYRDGAGQEVKRRSKEGGGTTAAEHERIRHLIPIRDALRDVFAADLAKDEEAGSAARALLNEHYDRFVEKFGPVNKATFRYQRPTIGQQEAARLEAREEARFTGEYFDDGDFNPGPMLDNKAKVSEIGKARQAARDQAAAAGRKFNEGTFDPAEMPDNVYEQRPNIKPFMSDPESYRLRSIEKYNDATGESGKKDIFYRSILKFEEEPEIKSANDGVLWSMNKLGKFDVDAIAEKMGKDRADIVQELGDSIYKVPGTSDTYQTKDEYLSGDIVSKLETARAEGETDPDVRRNIPALEAALPPPLPPSEISMLLGMPWIPVQTVRDFVADHLELGNPAIGHSTITGTWYVNGEGMESAAGAAKWGTPDRNAFELLGDTMNRLPPRIYRWEGSGEDRKRVFDAVATQAAQDRVDQIKGEFTNWVAADTERADGLAKLYNDTMNRTVLRQYDGSYMTTPGVSDEWKWRPHQTRVVARIVQSGNTYMGHAVGAGKTSAMIGAGMEMRRLGLVRKPLYVVPNHMLGQFTKEFYEQYPTARISVADEERFHTDRRRQFVANVSQDDLDAVIMTHSSFGKLPIGDDFQAHLIQEQVDMLDEAIRELEGQENRIARGRIENQKEKLEQKLSKAGKPDQDQTLSFEEMGADFLFVDEAHQFRKLSFASKQSGMKGISPEGSDMAWDLYTKVRYLDSQKPGRSVVFASGTPITNTMGELYSLSRYMQPQELAKRGLTHFDSWAQTFGDTKTGLEETAAGTYQPVTRFGKFVNLPELYKMVGENMDVVTSAQLEQYVTRPSLQGGARQFHLAPRTEILDNYQAELGARMQAIKDRKGPPKKGDDIMLTVINDGRHSAIDPRFVEETQNDPRSKLNMMISNVARIYHDTGDKQFYDPASNYQKESFKGPATQMIFANLGVNGRGPMGFSTYQWIKEALRREGVAPEHLAFIGDYNSALERQKLFNDMNDGTVRILVGSTQKMGTGVNAQRRLYALHNLDPLWYPADDEQRVGRILRQGNHNPEIEVHDYSTKGTYDSAMWKMMGNKARFIEQFFRGDPNLRDMEDIGEASMYEQASAMATTDERIITLTQMKHDLDKAQRQRAGHDREQYSLRAQLKQARSDQDYYTKRAASIRQDIERREDITGDKFTATIGGKEYTKRHEAAEALQKLTAERADGLGKNSDTVIGRIGGFPLVMERGTDPMDLRFGIRRSDGSVSYVNANWHGGNAMQDKLLEDWNKLTEEEQAKSLWKPKTPGATGIIASTESQLRKFEQWEQDARLNVSDAARKEENIRPLIGQEFTGGDDITRLSNAVNDLEGQLKHEAEEKAGKAPEEPEGPTELEQRLRQSVQGKIRIAPGEVQSVITLARTANASTFMHETAHDWLKQLMMDAGHELAPDQLRADAATVRQWLKRGDGWTGFKANGAPDTAPQERFARGFEQYLREGVAPSKALASVFAQFKSWLTTIYRTLKGLGAPISDDIRGVFDRMLAIEPNRATTAEAHEGQPGLGAVHAADAAETEPHEAEAVADRMAAERNRAITTPPPEIANELATQEAAGQPGAGTTTEPGGETIGGAGGSGEVAPGGGQPEPAAKGGGVGAGHGDVGAGGGEASAEGTSVSERPSGANGRRGAGSSPGAEQFAPSPAETFPDTPDRDVDLAGNIRVENLTDVQSIADAIHASAERNGDFRNVRGGMTKGQMGVLAESLGLDAADLDETRLTRLFGGTQMLGAKILAARRLVVQSAGIVANLMKVAAESEVDLDVAALGVAIARHDMIQSALAGVTAEWGRAGNAFHSLLEGWDKAQDLNQLLKDNLGRDLYQLQAIAKMGSRLDTPGKVSKYLRDAKQRSFGRMLMEYWINGLISGPSTHVTYSVGNVILASMKAGPETALAAGIGALRQGFGRQGERVRLGEVGAQFRGALREAPAAAQASIEAMRSGVTTLLPGETGRPVMPFQGDTTLTVGRNMTNAPVTWREAGADAYSLVQGLRDGLVSTAELVSAGGEAGSPFLRAQYSPLGAIPDIQVKGVTVLPVGTLARLPSRSVAAIHSLFRATNYSMEINALAYRTAMQEWDAGGMTSTAFAARVADLRQNPTDEMMATARGRATDLTLMGQGSAWVNKLGSLFNHEFNVPGLGPTAMLKFVDPFVHIAANIIDQALVKRTPLGWLSSELRSDLLGRNGTIAQDTAQARMLAGTALSLGAIGFASQGLVSGSGPSDPNKAAMWRLAGNQAHSVRIGDIWYDMHRLGPMGMLLSVAADMYDVAHQIGTEDADVVGKSLMHAFTQNVLDESFMRGPADLIKATTDPGRYGSGYVRNFLASFTPYSVGMAQMARATDPYARQARTIMDTIRAHTPGLSESLFYRRDIWGNPMPNSDALIAPGVTAIYAQHASNDPVNLAMLALGIAPAQVERQIRNVPLTDREFDDFVRIAGGMTKMRLDTVVQSPDYQNWPNATRHEVIEEVIRQSREAARGVIMMKYPHIPHDAAVLQLQRRTGENARPIE